MAKHNSTKAVLVAVSTNAIVAFAKFIGFLLSGSSALFAEAVHSVADTANQALLYLGIKRSQKASTNEYHFGFGQESYFWNVVSSITIFFLGCAYTIMHSIESLHNNNNVAEVSIVAYIVLIVAFLSEGYSWLVAFKEINSQRSADKVPFFRYLKNTKDPVVLAVFVEDTAAILGLALAFIGMLMTSMTGSEVFDGIAALLIGILMGILAMFLASTNKKYLINKSDTELVSNIKESWKHDDHIEKAHHATSVILSPYETAFFADIELSEEKIFKDMTKNEIEMAIKFMDKVDQIRHSIESNIKTNHHECKHIYIEFNLNKRD